ncbi:hypothetical protein G6O69_35930 [Pseudenhygromyxa sp. WMMC2535]|uniref:hypothetical protein n=1 Tax=Pseudenhygromyxa sp. WMMC2535 TaxID=2712867 RepID=UPI0015573731|nr:hypothetical protein [Pseudenhygromyxa sp. WMMC2535]NVB43270.1 hypothetical protein [Pseudenhygromyxa sp. WMMC2535]
MKRLPSILSCAALATSLSLTVGCSDDGASDDDESGETSEETGETEGSDRVEVSEDITADTTWTADKTYVLTDYIYVSGATLTIEPGTTILGANNSALIIVQDAMLMAEGTADAPIVFTSNNSSSPAAGDWGGVVLLGAATTNLGAPGLAEGFPEPPNYGGSDDAHNCGSLEYVRVEYAGFTLSDGSELNGITFYACGTATKASYVQVHKGSDDGIEFFGGGFDLDHIVVTGAADDSIDVDQGFTGTIQHVFIQQEEGNGDNCFEVSNQGTDFSATPKTAPEICNVTCVGAGEGAEKSKGVTIKEGTHGSWQANIFTNIALEATLLADEATFTEADAGNITIENNIFFGNYGDPEHNSGAESLDAAGWTAWVEDESRANLATDPGLGSVAWGGASIVPSGDVAGNGSGCGGTSYIGAVDPAGDDWTTASWINYAD